MPSWTCAVGKAMVNVPRNMVLLSRVAVLVSFGFAIGFTAYNYGQMRGINRCVEMVTQVLSERTLK